MRALYPILPVLMFFSGFALLFAGEAEKRERQEFRMRPTHEELKAKQAASRASRLDRQAPAKLEKPEAKKKEGPDSSSLINRSAILSSGRNWTIVPKGAVLHVPERLKGQVNGARNGKLVPWQTFYSQNRGWIHVHSVSMEQARGDKKMDPKQVETYKGLSRVVVSVCHGGPISVMAPKEEEPAEEEVAPTIAVPVIKR